MRFGFSPVQSQARFEACRRQAALAEALGFDVLWAHEHHVGGTIYPCPLITLAAIADVTRGIGLGTNMLLLPLYHPLRVAQEAAMVDVLSGGRLILGVSAGYAAEEFQAFGVPLGERGRRMREGVTLIRAVWAQDSMTVEGSSFALRDFSLFPKPLQTPPPIYIGAVAAPAIRRAARLADGFVIGAPTARGEVAERIGIYERSVLALGQQPADKVIVLNRLVHVVTDQAAKARAEDFFAERFLHFYGRWGHRDVTRADVRAGTPALTSREYFIVGEATECIDRVEEYAAMGIQHLACLMNFGGPDVEAVERSMRLFAELVMPRFR
jgi:alkanesulfonate monooxygenase SsuD/methylene tetrahydromethanopterin reductase-like flavin-dependent oxidoreductase (luciferase family)